MARKTKYYYIYRSAVTGKFVSKNYALRYPKRTISIKRKRA